MRLSFLCRILLVIGVLTLMCNTVSADENSYNEARALQREGNYDQAIEAYKIYLTYPFDRELTVQDLGLYTDALLQLMNTFQSKGEPEACILTLQEIYNKSVTIQSLHPDT